MGKDEKRRKRQKEAAAQDDQADGSASSSQPSELHTFAGFRVLPVTVPPPTVLSRPTPTLHTHINATTLADYEPEHPATTHFIFMREHKSHRESDELPPQRTLFLVNLPVDTNMMHLRRLFRRCGSIERVVWKSSATNASDGSDKDAVVSETLLRRARGWIHPSGAHAHVVFADNESVSRALDMKARRRLWSDDAENDSAESENAVGMSKWIAQHAAMFPDVSGLESQVDLAMAMFDDAEEQARRDFERRRNVPDEDGFVLVSRKPVKSAAVPDADEKNGDEKKPKDYALADFYRFQRRENARNQLAELRRKFDEDKAKIASLKTKHRFKPY